MHACEGPFDCCSNCSATTASFLGATLIDFIVGTITSASPSQILINTPTAANIHTLITVPKKHILILRIKYHIPTYHNHVYRATTEPGHQPHCRRCYKAKEQSSRHRIRRPTDLGFAEVDRWHPGTMQIICFPNHFHISTLILNVQTCMMTTRRADGQLVSRAMQTRSRDNAVDLW